MDNTSQTLLRKASAGDESACKQMYKIYGPFVARIAKYCGAKNSQDIEDIAQETFKSMFGQLPTFNRERTGSLRKWLRTVTRRTAHNLQMRSRQVLGADLARVGELEIIDDAHFSEFMRQIDIKDVLRSIWESVRSQLSSRDAAIFEATAFRERDFGDVAREANVSIGVVHKVRSRTFKMCREIAIDLYGLDPFEDVV